MSGSDMEKREAAYQDYAAGMKYQQIADKHGVTLSAVKSWATRYWKKGATATVQPKKLQPDAKKVATEKVAVATGEDDGLNDKQRLFCRYYANSLNATQSYLKAYGCDYNTANTNGPALLVNACVRKEVERLKEIKFQAAMMDVRDLFEVHKRIATSNMTDFVEFENKRKPVKYQGKPVMLEDPKTGEEKVVAEDYNIVRIKKSSEVDGMLIAEVSEGREGVKVKLVDKQKSLAFLERYLGANPMDRHKKEYDNRKLAMEQERLDLIREKDDVEIEDTEDVDGVIYG